MDRRTKSSYSLKLLLSCIPLNENTTVSTELAFAFRSTSRRCKGDRADSTTRFQRIAACFVPLRSGIGSVKPQHRSPPVTVAAAPATWPDDKPGSTTTAILCNTCTTSDENLPTSTDSRAFLHAWTVSERVLHAPRFRSDPLFCHAQPASLLFQGRPELLQCPKDPPKGPR